MTYRDRVRIELARRDFWEYCKLLAPDFYKEDRKFLKDKCREYQDFYESQEEYLIDNEPPRHGKSRTATLFVQWVIGKCPKDKIITGSYNETLSTSLFHSLYFSHLSWQAVCRSSHPLHGGLSLIGESIGFDIFYRTFHTVI